MTENAGKLEETNLPEVAEVKSKEVSLLGGIVPKDFSELTRFASLVHTSNLAPKDFDTVEKVAIGMLTNMELGRPIITGLQDLAIINGRCGIYGDASLAMVTASGFMDEGYPKSEETGTPYQDDWTFRFTVKRIGRPEETGIWSWIDSKKAGFDDPKTKDGRKDIWSPWTRFTRRMMQWKARNFVMRDNFGDVLKGMKTVEDLHDLDAVPLTKGAGGTYSAEPSTASDLTEAIKEKAEVEQKEEKLPTPIICPYCNAPIKTVIIRMLESGATSFTCPICDEKGKIEDGLPVVIPPVDAENPVTEGKPEPDFRSEWIRLQGPGFSTYFYKNRVRFESAPIEIQEEARVKWLKLYKTPWPLAVDNEEDYLLDEIKKFPEATRNAVTTSLGFDDLGRGLHISELKELLEGLKKTSQRLKEALQTSSESEELKAVTTEINDYFPMKTVDQAQKNLELPTNRALSLDESNQLLAECQRLTKSG